MLREEINHLRRASARDLRKFGLVVGAVFVALGLWFLFREKSYTWFILAPGLLLVSFGATAPRVLRWPYVGWMTLALALGTIVSTLLLILIFILVVTPIGLLARATGRDFLHRRRLPEAASYWIVRADRRQKKPHEHEQQF
jgi:hypothetical protein